MHSQTARERGDLLKRLEERLFIAKDKQKNGILCVHHDVNHVFGNIMYLFACKYSRELYSSNIWEKSLI